MWKLKCSECGRDFLIALVAAFLFVLSICFYSQMQDLVQENAALKTNYTELENITMICMEGFYGCYNDLKTCVVKQYNITKEELEALINLTTLLYGN